jgi:hypothetical protein
MHWNHYRKNAYACPQDISDTIERISIISDYQYLRKNLEI